MQRSYDVAYMQCMYARGNQVPGQVVSRRQPVYSYPPPNYPAPAAARVSAGANYPPPNTPPPVGVAPPRLTPRGPGRRGRCRCVN